MGWQASRENTNYLDTDTIEGKPDTIGTWNIYYMKTIKPGVDQIGPVVD